MKRSKMMQWGRLSLAALAAAQLVAWTPPWLSSEPVLTLGASVQLSGGLAGTGRYYRDAYQFTVDKINESGITVDGKKYKVALRLLDHKSDPGVNVTQHERLGARDKVNVLLGSFSSNAVLAGAAVAEKNHVPMVQAGGASSRIFARGYKYVFGTLPAADDYFG